MRLGPFTPPRSSLSWPRPKSWPSPGCPRLVASAARTEPSESPEGLAAAVPAGTCRQILSRRGLRARGAAARARGCHPCWQPWARHPSAGARSVARPSWSGASWATPSPVRSGAALGAAARAAVRALRAARAHSTRASSCSPSPTRRRGSSHGGGSAHHDHRCWGCSPVTPSGATSGRFDSRTLPPQRSRITMSRQWARLVGGRRARIARWRHARKRR